MVIVEVLPAENKHNELKQGHSDLPLHDEDENLKPPAKRAKKEFCQDMTISEIWVAVLFFTPTNSMWVAS